MTVPARVYDLVERFDRNREAYLSSYNETQLRGDFLDPLLEEFGWDVHNRQGHPEAYRQVIEEDKLKTGGGTKAPDYGFYVGGARKFFLEAKKPSVDIAGDVAPAVQLRRYAWSAQLALHQKPILHQKQPFCTKKSFAEFSEKAFCTKSLNCTKSRARLLFSSYEFRLLYGRCVGRKAGRGHRCRPSILHT